MEPTFWNGFLQSLDFETRNVQVIQGASGIKHQILSLGVDEKQKRIVIVQDEQDARILSMVQADVQAQVKEYSILMVRPVSINLSSAFSGMAMLLGGFKFTQKDLQELSQRGEAEDINTATKSNLESLISLVTPQIDIIQKTKPNLVSVFQEIIQQLSSLKFLQNIDEGNNFVFDFEEILTFNPVIHDNSLGICPIPLYDFSVDEAESFVKKNHNDLNKMILKKHGIYQFFFPPADSLALGLIENNTYSSKEILRQVEKVPNFGHPFGENELTDIKNITEVVDALKDKGLAVEGEFSLGITADGKEKRMLVKFSPRESIFKRLSNIISVKLDINLKDLLKP